MRILLVFTVLALSFFAAAPCRAQSPRFTNVSADCGLAIAANTGVGGTNSHAVAVEDFDGDGLADVILLTFGKPHVYYFRNLGKLRFRDMTASSGLAGFEGDGTGAAVADFDRDGKLDVYLTSLRKGASRLFQGRGDGTFADVSEKAGVLLRSAARSCAWSDIDLDGRPDLYVTCPEGPNLLFQNRAAGFVNIAGAAGVELADKHSLGCAFGDANGDGLDDLFVTNYQSQVSALFRNLGSGKFQDITAELGLARKASSVGCAWGDLDNRGVLDLYVTTDSWLSGANYTEPELLKMGHAVEPNELYANHGKFTPLPKGNGTHDALRRYKTLSHDVVLEDLDHDGRLDIYVGVDAESGNQWATSKGGNPLWTRPDGNTWRELGSDWGLRHEANCVCVPAVDFDNDGDLDLLLVNFYSQPVLLRNETNGQNWLQVRAVGTKSSRDGIGAKVSVFTIEGQAKKLAAYRQIHSGAGYCRSSPLSAHVGLGASPATAYRVEVLFPGAKTPVVHGNVKSGQRLVVREE